MQNYTKTTLTKNLLKKGTGEGLILSEGEEWKMKRRVLTQVFNFDFLKQLAPEIARMADQVFDKMEQSSGEGMKYDALEAATELAGNVMIDGFFGKGIQVDRIEGKTVYLYAKEVLEGLTLQRRDPLYFLFGQKFLELGIRKMDREMNRKVAVYEAWGKGVVEGKIKEIKARAEKGGLGEKPSNLIEAIVMDSLKAKKEDELLYDEQSIFDEFRTFFFAGVDTTSSYLATMIYLVAKHPEV